MNLLKVILFVADPLIVAFIVSVFIGAFFKNSSGKMLAKYCLCGLSFLCYLLVYAIGVFLYKDTIWMYIAMFAPFALLLIVLIISIIVAPKGEKAKQLEDENTEHFSGFTGFDSLFPNDIDKDRNTGDESIDYDDTFL